MDHKHVRIAVVDAEPPGAEDVPARQLNENEWELLRSPLYATGVAAGDIVRVVNRKMGSFEVISRGGNVCVQFYLGDLDADDEHATARVATIIESRIAPLGGRIDGMTPGLLSCTVGANAGFEVIEAAFDAAVEQCLGAQWQFANLFDG